MLLSSPWGSSCANSRKPTKRSRSCWLTSRRNDRKSTTIGSLPRRNSRIRKASWSTKKEKSKIWAKTTPWPSTYISKSHNAFIQNQTRHADSAWPAERAPQRCWDHLETIGRWAQDSVTITQDGHQVLGSLPQRAIDFAEWLHLRT